MRTIGALTKKCNILYHNTNLTLLPQTNSMKALFISVIDLSMRTSVTCRLGLDFTYLNSLDGLDPGLNKV